MYEDLLKTFSGELDLIWKRYEQDHSEHWRRVLVRSVFAAMDALSRAMMFVALPRIVGQLATRQTTWQHELGDPNCAAKEFFEVCALSNLTFDVNDKGEIDLKPMKVNLARQMLFAIRMMSKVTGVSFNPKEVEGWAEFNSSVKVRDRITHPKKPQDLVVTEEEMKSAIAGMHWLILCNRKATGA